MKHYSIPQTEMMLLMSGVQLMAGSGSTVTAPTGSLTPGGQGPVNDQIAE